MILSCIVCGFQPDEAHYFCSENHPYLATSFRTRGHYGSTFFDPMDESSIEINVCDCCLEKARDKNQILYYDGGSHGEIYTKDHGHP